LILALALLFVGLRSIYLDADPPTMFGTRAARELVAEPAAKSHEARNYALFDSYHLNEADDYQFWRAQSPVWVYPLTAFFKTFGVDWPELRLYSALYAALGLIAALAIAVRFATPAAVCFIGGLVAIDSVYFHYARAGLIEPAVSSWLAVSMLALILAERNPSWFVVAHWALVLGFFTKQAALVAVPVVGLATLLLLRAARSQPGAGRVFTIVIGNAVLICAIAGLYVLNTDYLRALQHNVNHVLLGSDALPEYKYTGPLSLFTRIVADGRYKHFFITVPVTGPLALIALGVAAFHFVRARRLPYASMVLLGWFACSFGAMFAVAWSALRFWTIVVLPAAVVAGLALDALYLELSKRGRARLFEALALAGAIGLFGAHAYQLRKPLFRPTFTLRDGAAAIVAAIGPQDATLIGARSPPMALGTPYKNFYVRSQFNATRAQLAQLAPTHFLFLTTRDGSNDILRRELPEVAKAMVPLLDLKVRGDSLRLYARGPVQSAAKLR
jgi:hypothetical protein